MRRLINFDCAGETLAGTLDLADGPIGLLIVSGGNEIRCGAHRGMAWLAAQLAARGISVFRFDRRGIGDSTGANHGYAESRPDITAAIAAFRAAAPRVKRLVGFGNCNAATALLLFGDQLDHLILANPWLDGSSDGLPPADAIKAHYASRIASPSAWGRALTGGVNLKKLASGLGKIAGDRAGDASSVETSVIDALRKHPGHDIILASGDATAIGFGAAAARAQLQNWIQIIETDSHSFARPGDQDALLQFILDRIGSP